MILFLTGLFVSTVLNFSSDPLFSRMAGHWTGVGVRQYSLSERRSQISVDVHSSVQLIDGKERLISKNQVTESFEGSTPDGGSKTYQAAYWIEAKTGISGSYELGSLASPPGPFQLSGQVSEGSFLSDQLIFETSQVFGDYIIHSQTQFTDTGSTYTEIMTLGAKTLSHTVIQYVPSRN